MRGKKKFSIYLLAPWKKKFKRTLQRLMGR